MSKTKIILIFVVLAVLAAGGASGYLLISSKNRSANSQNISNVFSRKEEVKADLSYDDSSGFSFKYPTGIKVDDVTPTDASYYTLLTLSKGGQNMQITIKDIKASSVDVWLKSDESQAGATLVGATTLGGISAKQYATSSKLLTAGIDGGILYLIEGPKDGGYWEDSQNVVASTFSFAGSKDTSGGDNSSDNTVYEEEEVIQ